MIKIPDKSQGLNLISWELTMKEFFAFAILTGAFVYGAGHYGIWNEFRSRAEVVHNYEYKSLELAQKLRLAQREITELKIELAKLKAKNEHISLQDGQGKSRGIASIKSPDAKDLVKFDVYKWTPEKLLGVGKRELHFKNFEKSAQFYQALFKHHGAFEGITDEVYFEAGISAYETGMHYDWAQLAFSTLIKKYPDSKLQRGAKLWLALSHFHQGNEKEFMHTVEEFKMKYRNTKEWTLLSKYYEDLAYKYKK